MADIAVQCCLIGGTEGDDIEDMEEAEDDIDDENDTDYVPFVDNYEENSDEDELEEDW